MSVTEKDLVFISITSQMEIFAEYTADKRQLYEYPRAGYGDYNQRGNSKIKNGILGELAFLEYIHSHLLKVTQSLDVKDRWKILHEKAKFSYHPVIGNFDGGFEFKIGDKTIDIKTYETNQVSVNQIFKGLKEQGRPLSLFIDKSQNTNATIYVQVFRMEDNRMCLAGFHEGLPEIATWMPKPAYTCAVPLLQKMDSLLDYLELI
jgi:hypothetical protein